MTHYDVAVLGSGFGGCLSALILDRLGLRPVVLDRAAHPRFAIGESSTPIADFILRDLADRYGLPRLRPLSAYGTWKRHYPHLGVGRKRGFSYFRHEAGTPFRPDPEHDNELLVAASASDEACDTHWLRADVDGFFADEVRRAGIPFLERTAVSVRQRTTGWVVEGVRADAPVTLSARFVLDATGAGGVLPRTLGLTNIADTFRTHSRAVFSHFTGVRRWQDLMEAWDGSTSDHPFPCDAAALHHVFDGGWMWVLPFDTGVVSAGFVLDPRVHPFDPDMPAAAEWTALLRRYPSIAAQFADARIVHPPGEIMRTGRLQRCVARAAGQDWALLPFTAGFIDPLHSTGIAHTLSGVERLMALIERHWDRPSFTDALADYSTAIIHEHRLVDTLVSTCYEAASCFDRYRTSVLLYFAAVVHYEQARRIAGEDIRDRAFLGADDPALVAMITDAADRLRTLQETNARPAEVARAYERHVEAAIAPYNTVGLFRPPRPYMYHHTAARD